MNRLMKLALMSAAGLALAGCVTGGQKVAATNPCQNLSVSIYFDRDSAQLTREARGVLKEAAVMRRGCAAGVVDVLGLADPVGDPAANQVLSAKRAKTVTAALGGLGFGAVNIAAAGDTGSVTGSGQVNPLRRRAEIVFRQP